MNVTVPIYANAVLDVVICMRPLLIARPQSRNVYFHFENLSCLCKAFFNLSIFIRNRKLKPVITDIRKTGAAQSVGYFFI